MSSGNYRATARSSLRGYWGTSVLVTLVASILGGAGTYSSGGSAASSSASNAQVQDSIAQINMYPAALTVLLAILSVIFILALVGIVFGGAVRLGLATYNVDLITRRKPPVFSTLFSRFNIFGRAFLLNLLVSIFISLWTLLLIIPGIIATFRYAMAPYIMADNPDIGAMEAISRSKEMMKGNKWRLFVLHLSFIGWALLTLFTLGIGTLWLLPYINAAEAAFYLDVSGKSVQRQSIPDGPETA